MVLSLGALILFTGVRLQRATLEQAAHDLETQAFIIASSVREPVARREEGHTDDDALSKLAQAYARDTNTQVTIVNQAAEVLASSARHDEDDDDHDGLERAPLTTPGHVIRQDPATGRERLIAMAPIAQDNGAPVGFIQLSAPMDPVYGEMRRVWWPLLTTAGLILAVTALVSLALAGAIARPIEHLTAGAEAMAAGDLAQHVTPGGPDEVRRLGESFNRMAERVRDMLARQRDFTAYAAHELRSPLTGLRLRLEMLQKYPDDPVLAGRYTDQMGREIQHLQRLVDHLLALTAADEADAAPRVALDLAPLLYDLADEMGPLVREAGLRLDVDVPDHLPAVQANAEQLGIAVHNLLDNAVKYTPAGGAVRLSARESGGKVAISVADTGVGIPAEALPHIFQRFYRVDKARSRRQGGAGLGLSLVQRIVEAHGGAVTVASQPNAGSTFTITLPTRS